MLRRLRERYIAEAPGRLAELWDALGRLQNGDRQAPGELALLLHRLAGSGGSYGLDAVTERSRAAEQVVHSLVAQEAAPTQEEIALIRDHIHSIAEAFAEAR